MKDEFWLWFCIIIMFICIIFGVVLILNNRSTLPSDTFSYLIETSGAKYLSNSYYVSDGVLTVERAFKVSGSGEYMSYSPPVKLITSAFTVTSGTLKAAPVKLIFPQNP